MLKDRPRTCHGVLSTSLPTTVMSCQCHNFTEYSMIMYNSDALRMSHKMYIRTYEV